jgi:hypothetical protein
VASDPARLAANEPRAGAVASDVSVIDREADAAPAPFVVVIARPVDTALDPQLRPLAAGLPTTNPDVYVQPVELVSVPNVDPAIPDSASMPVLVNVRLPAADGRK